MGVGRVLGARRAAEEFASLLHLAAPVVDFAHPVGCFGDEFPVFGVRQRVLVVPDRLGVFLAPVMHFGEVGGGQGGGGMPEVDQRQEPRRRGVEVAAALGDHPEVHRRLRGQLRVGGLPRPQAPLAGLRVVLGVEGHRRQFQQRFARVPVIRLGLDQPQVGLPGLVELALLAQRLRQRVGGHRREPVVGAVRGFAECLDHPGAVTHVVELQPECRRHLRTLNTLRILNTLRGLDVLRILNTLRGLDVLWARQEFLGLARTVVVRQLD